MFKKIAVAAVLATLAASSFAAAPGFYAGVDVGSTKVDGLSGDKTSYGILGGYNFNQNVAVEVGYARLAKWNISGTSLNLDQADVSVIGTVPLNNQFSIYGRLGYNNLDASVDGYSVATSGVLYGVGVGYNFNNKVSGRLEVQRPASDVTNVRVGVVYAF
jgi:hypothetical protein